MSDSSIRKMRDLAVDSLECKYLDPRCATSEECYCYGTPKVRVFRRVDVPEEYLATPEPTPAFGRLRTRAVYEGPETDVFRTPQQEMDFQRAMERIQRQLREATFTNPPQFITPVVEWGVPTGITPTEPPNNADAPWMTPQALTGPFFDDAGDQWDDPDDDGMEVDDGTV